ncbi:MAG: ABC transporter permease [Candidatus Izemoplasma sp.]|nr:ABC transporter permease [Candidatus Izemoplasma sp.]
MHSWLIVFKKEFYRVFSDRRLIFTAIILPGLAIYVMYSIMGSAINGEVDDITSHEIIVYHDNMPDSYKTHLTSLNRDFAFHDGESLSQDTIKEMLSQNEMDIYLSFPENFTQDLIDYDDPNYTIPSVNIIYNSGEKYSSNSYSVIANALNSYTNEILYGRFGDGIVAFHSSITDTVDESRATGQIFASILPMIIVMFLFSGAMSIGPDSIAGEKERGTVATLLVTPIKRSQIAIGKVISLTVVSLFSAMSSFVGILLSLPKLMNMDNLGGNVNIYGLQDYLMILLVLLMTVFFIVGIVSLVSTYAKTIKEAGMLILPFYFISIIVGVSSMFNGEAATDLWAYIIPIYNTINLLIAILTFDVIMMHLIVMVISNTIYVVILIYFMTQMFQSEKIMFQS